MLAVHCLTGHLGHAQCSSQSQILVRNGVFGGYGRAQTQNDGRTPRKLVDKDRNTVGEMRMRVGRGGRYRFIRVARAFYGSESRSSFGAAPRLRAPLHAPPPPPPAPPPPSPPRP